MKEWSEKNNERPRVPVLRISGDDGLEEIMPESNDINLFLDALDGKPDFTPEKDSASHTEMLKWFDWCNDELKPVLDLYKYGENRKFDSEKHSVHNEQLKALVQILEDTLENRKYLIEDRMTLADIAIIPFIRQIMRTREGEFDFTPYPKILAWANSIIETEWFKNEVM